jgi:hypothetical protein
MALVSAAAHSRKLEGLTAIHLVEVDLQALAGLTYGPWFSVARQASPL